MPKLNCAQSQANAIIAADSSNWIVAGWVGDCYTAYVAKLDCSGEVLWQKYAGGYAKFIHAELCMNGDVVAAGYDWGADDAGGDEGALICRYDSDGVEVFQKKYVLQPQNSNIHVYFTRVVEASNGNIYAAFNDRLLQLDSNGDSLVTVSPDYGNINSLVIDYHKDIVVGCDSGIVVLDSVGTILQKIPLGVVGVITQNPQAQYLAVVNSNLNLLDTAFNVVITTTSGNVVALEPVDSGFFALRQHETEFYDWNLTWVDDIWSATASDFAVSNSRIAISGVESFVISRMLIQVIDFQGASVERKTDIRIESVKITDLRSVFRDSIFGYVRYDYHFTAETMVRNVGSDTIKDFSLLSQRFGGMNCAEFRYSRLISNIALAPGDTMVQTLGGTLFDYSAGANFSLCLYAIAPNSALDINKADNSACSESVVLSQNQVNNDASFSLFPNPCSDRLYLQLQNIGNAIAEIFSVDGAIVGKTIVTQGTTNLNVESLPPGFYITKLTFDDNTVVCRKLVKL